jgi:hypothetical protein
MSGGGTNTVTNSGPPEWSVPYYQSYLQKAGQTADLPYQPYTDQRNADLNQYQNAGLNATANRALQGSQEVGQARQQLGDTLGGGYFGNVASNQFAGSNPFLQKMIDQSSDDIISKYQTVTKPQLDSQMARSGSFGNSGIQQMQGAALSDLTKNLGNIQNQYRFQDYGLQGQYGENAANRAQGAYEAERGRQFSGIGLAPTLANQDYIDARALSGVGDVYQQQEQRGLDTQYQNFLEARNYPREQLGVLGSALGANTGQTTSSQGPKGSPAAAGLGGAAAGASLAPALGIAGPYGAAAGAALGLLGGK